MLLYILFVKSLLINIIFESHVLKIFNNTEIIYDKNNQSNFNKFYVLISGNFIKESSGEIIATRNQLFGDIFIKNNSNPNYSIIAQGECRTIEFDWDEIFPKLNLNIDIAFKKFNLSDNSPSFI